MIPYIQIPPLVLGPIHIYPFGIMAVIAIFVASFIAQKRAVEFGIEPAFVKGAVIWVLVGGFAGAHLFDVLIYHPGDLLADPLLFFNITRGLSSFGGFIGGAVGLALYIRRNRLPFARFVDVMTLGLLAGWIFGRIGCSLAHDHPGFYSNFPLAVAYPGGARHDLGLYELIFVVILFFVVERIRRRPLPAGKIALMIGMLYAPVRFLLDFLRTEDVRYNHLTPAQIAAIILFALCLYFYRGKEKPKPPRFEVVKGGKSGKKQDKKGGKGEKGVKRGKGAKRVRRWKK